MTTLFSRIALALALTIPAVATAEAVNEPATVVRGFTDAMLSTLKLGETAGFQGRYDHLLPALENAFDIDFMSEKSLGSHFADLDAEQQSRWRALFLQYMVSNYASRLIKFSGQVFEQVGEEPSASETILVLTRVIDPGQENVDLNYRLRKTAAGWRIVDIYLKGTVSELALRRSDYVTVVKSQGFEALVEHLKKKIADMAAGKQG